MRNKLGIVIRMLSSASCDLLKIPCSRSFLASLCFYSSYSTSNGGSWRAWRNKKCRKATAPKQEEDQVENKMISTGIFIWETSRLTGSRTTNILLNSRQLTRPTLCACFSLISSLCSCSQQNTVPLNRFTMSSEINKLVQTRSYAIVNTTILQINMIATNTTLIRLFIKSRWNIFSEIGK